MAEISLKFLRTRAELTVLLAFFGFLLIAPINTNFVIYRTCYAVLNFNKSECERLGTSDADQDIEKQVQPYANIIMMTQSILTQIVPCILCLFIGPWSDKNGRKPIMLFTIIGFIIRGIVTVIVALIDSLSPWYLLIGNIPAAFFGGLAPLMMAVLCYITDVTTEANRGLRMGIVDAMMALGMLLGTISSSFVFAAGGYVLVYGLELLCSILSCLFVKFVIKESIEDSTDEDDTTIFTLRNIKDMFKATFRVRENYGRAILMLTFALSTISILAFSADTSVMFMFVREKLNWDLEHYTLFSGVASFAGILGTFVGVGLLHKLLKIPETPLMILGCLSYVASALLQGFAVLDWHIYLAGGIRSIYGVVSPMCRSLISKLLTKEEIGKVFSIAVSVDSLIVMMGGPIYTIIYNYTLDTNPGAYNFVSAGIFAVCVVLVGMVIVIQRKLLNANLYTTLSVNADEE
ncbi:hypothetical protein Trydic_g19707 [Trypoxylus dichotomus]